MSREKNLIKNTAILSLGTFVPKFITVFITPILTAKLTKAEYGSYDLVITLVALLLPATTLQISSAAFRFLIDQKDDNLKCKKIISSIFTFVVVTSVITCLLYYVLSGKKLGHIGILVCFYFVSDILMIAAQQVMRGMGKNLYYSFSTIIKAILDISMIIILLGVLGTKNFGLLGVMLSMSISAFASFNFLLIKGEIIKFYNIKYFDINTLKELLKYSWPMVPNNLSNWVLRVSDKVVITAALGVEANAIYAVATKLPTIFDSLQGTFTLAWQENASIASKDDDKDRYYSVMCTNVYNIFVGLMSGLIMTTPIVWKILIRGDYESAYYQLPVLYIGMLFSSFAATIGGIYIAHMKTKSVGITTTIAAVINLLIDILFVKKIGIWAGSISTMISYLVLVIYRMYDVQKFQKIRFEIKKMILGIVMLSIMAICSYQKKIAFDLINILICILVLFVFDKDIIIIIFKALFNKKIEKNKKKD